MVVWKDFFLEIPDLYRVCMGWDEICGSIGAREVGSGGGADIGRARGNEMGTEVTRLGAAGAGDEGERDGLGFGEIGIIGL